MVVFHCPDPEPEEYRKPYVKRVAGLPGESILIIDGDIYADGELARKGYAEVRETRVVVFDMEYVARPGGWNQRWLLEPTENDPRLPVISGRTAEPADSDVVASAMLTLDAMRATQPVISVSYRHWNHDTRQVEPITVWNSYDGVPLAFGKPAFDSLDSAHDFSFECEIEVVASSGEGSFACWLTDGLDLVSTTIPVGRKTTHAATMEHDGRGRIAEAGDVRLAPATTYRLEFSFVDRRAILAIDGRVALPPADLPPADAARARVFRPLWLEARGCKVVLRNIKLFRDIHYTQFGTHGVYDQMNQPHPAVMGPDEYFVLGDNSGNSQDSRKWPRPGVPEGEIIGKPFLIHQPLRPAQMTIGGRERHYQTVDWSRLRWLH
jgi:signal peptidase I